MVSGEGVGSGRGSFVMKVVAGGSVRGCCGSGVVVPGAGRGVGAVAGVGGDFLYSVKDFLRRVKVGISQAKVKNIVLAVFCL